MSTSHNGSGSHSPNSKNGIKSSIHSSLPQKKPSFLVRFIKGTFFQIFVFFTTIILLGAGYAAWTALDRNDAADGKPVTQTLMQGIVDNINDLNTRLTTLATNLSALATRVTILEIGQTTGGTVTGPLRWSSEYSGQNYDQAWTTCLGLTPLGSWRIPDAYEIEIGKNITPTLFTGNKSYWSSLPNPGAVGGQGFAAWNPTVTNWGFCSSWSSTCINSSNGLNSSPMVFRCVSNT